MNVANLEKKRLSILIEYTWSDADFELIQDFEWTLTMKYACKIKRAK